MRLLDYLDKRLIFMNMKATEKNDALLKICLHLEENGVVSASDDLYGEILNRENQGSTSIGNGVAIPHARLKKLDKIVLAIARLAEPIDPQIKGHEPVQMIVMLVTSTEKAGEYLRVLSKLSKVLRENGLLKKLLKADSADRLWGTLEAVENQDI